MIYYIKYGYISSRDFAMIFNKRHDTIVNKIKDILKVLNITSLLESDLIFYKQEYEHKNKKHPYYIISERGCVLLKLVSNKSFYPETAFNNLLCLLNYDNTLNNSDILKEGILTFYKKRNNYIANIIEKKQGEDLIQFENILLSLSKLHLFIFKNIPPDYNVLIDPVEKDIKKWYKTTDIKYAKNFYGIL